MNDLLEKLLNNKKYGDVCPDTIRRIIAECEGRYKKAKDMEKAVREKLHGITSAFMTETEYRRALESGSMEEILSCHASTRERMPLTAMDSLYDRLFPEEPASILDLACGLNPVYLAERYPAARITGVDISGQSVRIMKQRGIDARHGDLLCENAVPQERFDYALLFKILPLLERQKSGGAVDTLKRINAACIVVSFPTRTLGGRNVGMEENYSAWMEAQLPENRSISGRFTTDNELFYLLNEI